MSILQQGKLILTEIEACFSLLDENKVEELIVSIKNAKRVFFIGSGRSRLMLTAFCMRLNHLGILSYVAGSIPCPPVEKGDLVIAASGSVKTASVIAILENIRLKDVSVFIITTCSKMDNFVDSDTILTVPSPSELIHVESTGISSLGVYRKSSTYENSF